jgi:hypothetical protein
MQDAVQRAVPLYNDRARHLEVPRRWAENVSRPSFELVRHQCMDYLETVCREAAAVVASSGTAVDDVLVHMPGYASYSQVIDLMP